MSRAKLQLCNGILKNDASVSILLLFNAKMSDCQWDRWIGTTGGMAEELYTVRNDLRTLSAKSELSKLLRTYKRCEIKLYLATVGVVTVPVKSYTTQL